jgi:hypothetical protein
MRSGDPAATKRVANARTPGVDGRRKLGHRNLLISQSTNGYPIEPALKTFWLLGFPPRLVAPL